MGSGSIIWPIPIVFVLWKIGFIITNAVMQANKLGEIKDPSRWWQWLLFAIIFISLEIIVNSVIKSSDEQ